MRSMFALLTVLCAACSTVGVSSNTDVLITKYNVLSAITEFESKKMDSQQLVAVSGYLTFGDDKHNLWFRAEEYQYIRENLPPLSDPAWRKCISLENYGKFRRELLKYDGHDVVIVGYVNRYIPEAGEVNLGSCNDITISMGGVGAHVARLRD